MGGSSYLLTDSLVRLIAKNLGQLSNLNLRSCDSVTDVSLQALMKFKTPLKILNLSFCSKVTLSGIENFIRDCSSLQVLCLNGLTLMMMLSTTYTYYIVSATMLLINLRW